MLYGGVKDDNDPYDANGKINEFVDIGSFYEYISHNIYNLLNCDRVNKNGIITLGYIDIYNAYVAYINEILGNNMPQALP